MTIEKRFKKPEFPFCVQLETCSLNEENFSSQIGLEFVEWSAIVREHNKTISCQKTESESLSITVSKY